MMNIILKKNYVDMILGNLKQLYDDDERDIEILIKSYRYIYEDLKKLKEYNENIFFDYLFGLTLSYIIYIRDPRNGLGRRDESKVLLFVVFEYFNDKIEILDLLLKYYFTNGYWGDAKKIIEITLQPDKYNSITKYFKLELLEKIKINTCKIVKLQLEEDMINIKKLENIDNKSDEYKIIFNNISLCAKWMPMPMSKKKNGKDRIKICITLAIELFPHINENKHYVNYNKKKVYINEKSNDYYRYLNLINSYRHLIKNIRSVKNKRIFYNKRHPINLINHYKLNNEFNHKEIKEENNNINYQYEYIDLEKESDFFEIFIKNKIVVLFLKDYYDTVE